jgi:UDP:flavonoid glycosyltransferase YjiC (YdhE family)
MRPVALMFPDGNFLAHVSRLLEIAKVLRSKHDWDVRFAGSGRYVELARQAGFPCRDCFTVEKEDTLMLARRAAWVDPIWWSRVVAQSIRSDVEAIRAERPDVVVGDMHWSLRAAALECGVPHVSIINGAWTNYLDHPIRAFDDHVLTWIFGRSLATRLLPVFKNLMLRYWALPYRRRLSRSHPRVAIRNLFDVTSGDVTLLPDVPEFCPTRGLPSTMHYVGPIPWSPSLPVPDFVTRLDPSRKTVYVSMGSTGKGSSFEMALQAFADSEYQVVMTTGEIALSTASLPRGFFVTDFAPGAELMKRADVCINHGGNGTVYQALMAGVPVVGIPTHADQQLQLQLCERAGVGLMIPERTFSPESLRQAVNRVVGEPHYRENARRMAGVIARYGGAERAAELIVERMQWPSS